MVPRSASKRDQCALSIAVATMSGGGIEFVPLPARTITVGFANPCIRAYPAKAESGFAAGTCQTLMISALPDRCHGRTRSGHLRLCFSVAKTQMPATSAGITTQSNLITP
jgi:hypothetical protein